MKGSINVLVINPVDSTKIKVYGACALRESSFENATNEDSSFYQQTTEPETEKPIE